MGVGFELIVAGTSNPGHPAIPFFSLFIVIWGVIMLEFWKRKEKFTALEWGMLGYEAEEPVRAEFTDYEKISLTGEETLYFNQNKKRDLISMSFFIIILMCFAVVGTTACIYLIRYALSKSNQSANESAPIVASILNAIQIQIYGYLYSNVAEFLTDRENHMYVNVFVLPTNDCNFYDYIHFLI